VGIRTPRETTKHGRHVSFAVVGASLPYWFLKILDLIIRAMNTVYIWCSSYRMQICWDLASCACCMSLSKINCT